MSAVYNEIEPHACVALQALIDDGVIAPGRVEPRSIKDLKADDIRDANQLHLFAGGGLWSVAARLAAWPDDEPIWTASCPCQPFSQAGQRRGIDDERHLWPDVDRLICEANAAGHGPRIIVGEQVAGKAGYDWFNGVRSDLAAQGYGAWVVDTPACAVDAPHIRQRLYWVAVANADSEYQGRRRHAHARAGAGAGDARSRTVDQTARPNGSSLESSKLEGPQGQLLGSGGIRQTNGSRPADQPERRDELDGLVGHSFQSRLEGHTGHGDGEAGREIEDRPAAEADDGDLGDTDRTWELQRGEWGEGVHPERGRWDMHADGGNGEVNMAYSYGSRPDKIGSARSEDGDTSIGTRGRKRDELGNRHRPNGSFWSDHEWAICHDGKARRAKSGVRNVVDGVSFGVADQRDAGDDPVEKQIQAVIGHALLVPSFKGRTELWKITGNAINPVFAAQVIGALMDALTLEGIV